MPDESNFLLLPYTYVVEQEKLRWLLEVGYVMGSKHGGVLVSGERGTAKSTIARSFANMMRGKAPVTLPINATDDRVVGGWRINSLMDGKLEPEISLLEQADEAGMLYIDEVNLLDDHIVNLILDVVSTGLLVLERDGIDKEVAVSFMLVGTMNPDEGALRPQLLDRFGLFTKVEAERDSEVRRKILRTVLTFDIERDKSASSWLREGRERDRERRERIERARARLKHVDLTEETIGLCARVATEFEVVGHRAEIVMAQAARAAAALDNRTRTIPEDVWWVAPHAVMHRRRRAAYADGYTWSDEDTDRLGRIIPGAQLSQEA